MKSFFSGNYLGILITVLLTTGLLSCGFQLRGNTQIPEHALPVYLFKDDAFHDLRRKVTGHFKRSGVSITDNETAASTILTISSIKRSNSVISVDSLGRTGEVKLGTTVDFAMTISGILYQKKISVFKDVAFNPENILSHKKEEIILYDEMYSEIARLMLLQLQAKAKRNF